MNDELSSLDIESIKKQETIVFNEEQKIAYDAFMAGENIFVTGKAGTGKSTLLNEIKKSGKKVVVTATTGIAAIAVGGTTIHSHFGIIPSDAPKEYVLKNLFQVCKNKIKKTDILIIDEVSMLHPDFLDLLEYLARKIRTGNLFFGGMQLVFFGDFLQLPPIFKDNEEVKFAFETNTWISAMFRYIELKKIYRQNDQKFVDILSEIRGGNISEENLKLLNSHKFDKSKLPDGIVPVVLDATNNAAKYYNNLKLSEIKEETITFELRHSAGTNKGLLKKVSKLKKSARTEDFISLKIGCQVMLSINDYKKQYGVVNGSIGVIKGWNNGLPIVLFENGATFTIGINTWESLRYDVNNMTLVADCNITQIPLNLAWAITIHKSQGMTISYVYCKFARIFCESQVYVALSRAKNLEGLFVEGLEDYHVLSNPKALEFYKNIS